MGGTFFLYYFVPYKLPLNCICFTLLLTITNYTVGFSPSSPSEPRYCGSNTPTSMVLHCHKLSWLAKQSLTGQTLAAGCHWAALLLRCHLASLCYLTNPESHDSQSLNMFTDGAIMTHNMLHQFRCWLSTDKPQENHKHN